MLSPSPSLSHSSSFSLPVSFSLPWSLCPRWAPPDPPPPCPTVSELSDLSTSSPFRPSAMCPLPSVSQDHSLSPPHPHQLFSVSLSLPLSLTPRFALSLLFVSHSLGLPHLSCLSLSLGLSPRHWLPLPSCLKLHPLVPYLGLSPLLPLLVTQPSQAEVLDP